MLTQEMVLHRGNPFLPTCSPSFNEVPLRRRYVMALGNAGAIQAIRLIRRSVLNGGVPGQDHVKHIAIFGRLTMYEPNVDSCLRRLQLLIPHIPKSQTRN